MAQTYTASVTRTFTRVELLKTQIRIALLRTTRIPRGTLDRVMLGIENKWIKRINIYALNQDNLCHARLVIEVDWTRYDEEIAKGRTTVVVDDRWSDDAAIEV